MKFTIYNWSTGQVLRWGQCPDEHISMQAFEPGEAVIEGEYPGDRFYWDGLQMIEFPERPSASHRWDWPSKTWQADLADAKAKKHVQIEAERDRRAMAPVIVYDGKNLDADARATENLKSKLAEANSRLAQGTPFPAAQLVWRDADNVTHVFADTPSYKDWLDGFAIALGSRGTDAYAWSWQKKGELNAATTIAEVEALDLSA